MKNGRSKQLQRSRRDLEVALTDGAFGLFVHLHVSSFDRDLTGESRGLNRVGELESTTSHSDRRSIKGERVSSKGQKASVDVEKRSLEKGENTVSIKRHISLLKGGDTVDSEDETSVGRRDDVSVGKVES